LSWERGLRLLKAGARRLCFSTGLPPRCFRARWRLSQLLPLIFLGLTLSIAHPIVVLAADASPTAASAVPVAGTTTSPAPELFDPLSSGYLLKLVFSLVIVLAVMFVVVWLLKRTGRFNGRAGSYPLRVLTQMPVGTRERVLLVAVGERQMLLGVTQGQIESLGWVDPPLLPDATPNAHSPDGAFFQLMKNQMPKSKDSDGASGTSGASGKSTHE
jgi:flagellar protein FliO/FliZ